jgi:hypothetical protein
MDLTGFLKDSKGIFFHKDPDANITLALDFVDYLQAGDSLTTATVTLGTIAGDAAPLAFPTNGATDTSISSTKVIFRITAGTAGNIYPVQVTITTDEGDTDSRHFRVIVKDKGLI